MTRSGRVFVAPDPLVRSKDTKGKVKVGTEETDKVSLTLDEDVLTGRFAENEGDFGGKKVSIEEPNELLQIIQQSEFKVIE